MAYEMWWLFLGFAVPMVISPGPGNTVLAAAGGKFGMRGTLPFWMGFEAANLAWSLVYGLGLQQLFAQHAQFYTVLKWAGTIYLLYLAYGFFRASAGGELRDLKPLGFFDGFLSVSLNPKIHSMILVMFSQFLDPARPLWTQVVQLTTAFVIIGLVCHPLWIYGGRLMFIRFQSPAAVRLQGWLFGAAMLAVAGVTALG